MASTRILRYRRGGAELQARIDSLVAELAEVTAERDRLAVTVEGVREAAKRYERRG